LWGAVGVVVTGWYVAAAVPYNDEATLRQVAGIICRSPSAASPVAGLLMTGIQQQASFRHAAGSCHQLCTTHQRQPQDKH
jgi:hypothetical protein